MPFVSLQDVEASLKAKAIDKGRIMRVVQALTGRSLGRHDVTFILLVLLQSFCILPGACDALRAGGLG